MGVKRRAFLFGAAAIAGGGVFGLKYGSRRALSEAQVATVKPGEGGFDAWIKIAPDGTVTAYSPTIEMGQGAHGGQRMLVAEELDADLAQVRMEQAPALPGFSNPDIMRGFGQEFIGKPATYVPQALLELGARNIPVQLTGGSTALRFSALALRRAAAGARLLLAEEAAERLGVPASTIRTEKGRAIDPASGKSLGYGELAEAAAGRTLWSAAPLKPVRKGNLIGQTIPRTDMTGKVDGSVTYGMDVKLPGLRIATIAMAPVRGGKLSSVDEKPALAIKGVEKVVRLPEAVAVVANGYWPALKGVQALTPTFTDGGFGGLSSSGIFAEHDRLRAAGKPDKESTRGDVAAAFTARGAKVIEADYRAPYLHHAMMEPFAMTAHLKDGKLEVWGGLQDPLMTRHYAAKAAGLADEDVTIHVLPLGGAFGRRSPWICEIIEQIVALAKECPGPVKLIWSREQEVQHGSYRPQASARLKGAFKDGRITALQTDYAQKSDIEKEVAFIYDLPATSRRHFSHATNQLDGPFRSVNSNQFGFWTECFIDELAHAAGEDPYRLRRRHLKDGSREARVLDEAARLAGWGTPLPAGTGRGIAIVRGFGSIVAEVIEASVREDGYPKVHRVTAVVDCGTTVDPINAEAQIQGSIVQALSTAIVEEITLEKGAVVQSNFGDYPILRLADSPPVIDVHFIESGAELGGIGEPGVPPATPALVNALFAATGKRVRTLPIRDQAKA